MSLNKVFNPLYSVHQKSNLVIQKSGVNVQERWTSNQSVSGNTINFTTIDPPNAETLVSRLMLLRTTVRISSSSKVGDPSDIGFRNFPLNSIIQNAGLTINGYTFTERIEDHIHPTSRYFLDEEDANINTAGRIVDRFQTYAQAKGSNMDPLTNNFNSSYHSTRRFRLKQLIRNNVADGFSADYEVVEPLMMSMLRFNKFNQFDHNAFYNITTMSLNLNFSDKARMVVSSVVPKPTSLTAEFISSFDICQYFLTPDEESKRLLLPTFDNVAYYHYLKHRLETKNIAGDFNAFASTINNTNDLSTITKKTIQSDTFSLSTVPQRLFIYVELTPESKESFDCDSFANISRIRITFANDANTLSTFEEANLWGMSAQNGYKYGLLDWQYDTKTSNTDNTMTIIHGQGAVVCVDFSKDMQLPSGLAPGVLGNFNLRVEVEAYNLRPQVSGESAKTYRLCVLRQDNAMIEIRGGGCKDAENLISVDDVINAKVLEKEALVSYNQMRELYGGAFYDKPMDMAMQVIKMIGKKGLKAVSDMVAENKDGGLIVGGRKLTRADLARMSRGT
jgi:hypothetical protein